MSFAGFTQGADIQNTDHLVGYRAAAAGGERRWTVAMLKAAVAGRKLDFLGGRAGRGLRGGGRVETE
jgi:hypothetical protein